MTLSNAHSIYFIGIGGIGMSALARYFQREGKQVGGYDRTASVVTEALAEAGISVWFEPDPARVAAADLVIYTPAVPQTHPERLAAQELGKPLLKRAEVLGLISKGYRCIAVAGTHGKTTTSTMLTHLLRHAGLDVTAFLGGLSVNLGGNFVHGSGPWLVVEADEYDRSFLQLHPEWAIINSLDPDHLDIYGSEEEMKATYHQFAGQADQVLIQAELAEEAWPKPVKKVGVDGAYRVSLVAQDGLTSVFDFEGEGVVANGLRLSLPGMHNVHNMAAACALGVELGLDAAQLADGVSSFQGIYRRFELQLDLPEFSFIDDYAHHPQELRAVMQTARACFPDRQLLVLFQPHLFSRTRDFLPGFAQALDQADVALLMDIYPAREEPIPGITSQRILDQMTLPKKALVTREGLVDAITSQLDADTVLLTLGAGDIDKDVPRLKEALRQRFLTNS